MANITLLAEIRLIIEPVPEDCVEYPQWRFGLRAKILGLQMPTTFLFSFIASIDQKTFEQLRIANDGEELYMASTPSFSLVWSRPWREKPT